MPSISKIADMATWTRDTVFKNRWDSVGLAQQFPEYEIVKQFVQGARVKRDTAFQLRKELEISTPSSYENSYTNHPAETAAHKQGTKIQTPLVKVRTSMTFSEDEEDLQGKSDEQIIDVIQARTVKWRRDLWEGLELDLVRFPASATAFPDSLRGVNYWVTDATSVSTAGTLSMNAGDDPAGHTGGAGGITKASEPKWPNAVGEFAKVSQEDLFDLISQFLNRVKTMAIVPHPTNVPEVPDRVLYTIEPVQRAIERFYSASNENLGQDAGVYRNRPMFRGIPFVIWHALSDPDSEVQDSVGTVRLIDWNTFTLTVHENFDQKITGPIMLPNVPGQMVMYNESWLALDCVRRDRNLYLSTATTDLQPSS